MLAADIHCFCSSNLGSHSAQVSLAEPSLALPLQSLVLAPLFVWYEVWFELGFFTELKEEVQRRVDDNIRTLYREKKKAP